MTTPRMALWLAGASSLAAGACAEPPVKVPEAPPPVVVVTDPAEAPAALAPVRRALPTEPAEVEELLSDLCARMAEGDDDWLARHLLRPLPGHQPFENMARTHTWQEPRALVPVDPFWEAPKELELCRRPRRVESVRLAGERALAELRLDGQPFELALGIEEGWLRIERLAWVLPEVGPFPSARPSHPTHFQAQDRTRSAEGALFARSLQAITQASGCWSDYVAAEEGESEPDLSSVHVAVHFEGETVFAFADGIVPTVVLACLQQALRGPFRQAVVSDEALRALRERPGTLDQPVTRLFLLVLLDAEETGADVVEAAIGSSAP